MRNSINAYLAGIIDGEGCLSIHASRFKPGMRRRDASRMRKAERSLHYCLRIQVTNCDRRLMDWLISRVGGSVYNNGRRQGVWKQSWKWVLTGRKAQETLLLGTLPYLVLKREQALILLEFIRMDGEENPAKRQALKERLNILNRRGVPQEANTPTASQEVMIESVPTGDSGSDVAVM